MGLGRDATTRDLEVAILDRWHVDEQAVAPTLRACDQALATGAPALAPARALALVQDLDTLFRTLESPRPPDQETR
jgi:hypothetical protein